MPNKTYRLYPKAIVDIKSIYLYSSQKFGIKRTEDYIFAIQSSFQHLADDPLISRKCDYIHPDLRAFNVGSHYRFQNYQLRHCHYPCVTSINGL